MATTQQIIGTWILILLYSAAIIYLVAKGARKIKSMKDYAVGSMSFSPVFVGLSLAAAMTSAATFVINPGLIAVYGISGFLSFGVFFPLASLISLVVLTKSFRKYGTSVSAVSLASWIGKRYNSNGYSLFIAILSILLITFIVLILVALTKVLSQALNTDPVYTLLVMVVFVFIYMMFGGANSMVYTNTIQAGIMLIVAVILIGAGYEHLKDGIGAFFSKLVAIDPALVKPTNPGSSLFRDFYEIIFVQLVVGAAVVCQPHILTKSLLLKKESDVNRYLTTSVIVQGLFYLVVIAGLWARLSFPDMQSNGKALGVDGMIPAFVVKVFSQGWLAVSIGILVIMGLMSAGLSTLEGLIQSVSTTFTEDIVKPLFGSNIHSDKSYVLINRITIIGMGIISFILARNQILSPNLSVAIFAQNGVYAFFSITFIPIVFGIFVKNVELRASLAGSITALVVYFLVYYGLPYLVNNHLADFGFINRYLSGTVRNPAIAASTAIIFSFIVGLSMHFVFKKRVSLN
jgi:sodium/pantothenate symporter